MTIVARHRDHAAFVVLSAGWQDIFVRIFGEGKEII
jgi:hypothetical protein